uniref:Bm359, isoform a n=1 Tax=Brugia malayi TaxID=6279 RepID=A0A1I9G108_BRUMA|nr:Bm359, isoform a [Brugia malayi]
MNLCCFVDGTKRVKRIEISEPVNFEHKIHIGLDSIHGFDENNDELLKEIFREAQSLIANYFQQKLIAKEWYLARKDEWKLIKQQRSLKNTMDSIRLRCNKQSRPTLNIVKYFDQVKVFLVISTCTIKILK